MKFYLKLSVATVGFSINLLAQSVEPKTHISCGTPAPPQQWNSWFNSQVDAYKQQVTAGKSQAVNYVIPVIVHIISGNQNVGIFPNLSQAQINSQISVLNDDFAGSGFNVGLLASKAFSSVGAANTNISFCPAMLDPNGVPLAEPGIQRINYLQKGWTNPASPNNYNSYSTLMDQTIKPQSIWDPVRYLNVWVTDINANVQLLGYATFPAGAALPGLTGFGGPGTDGIVIWARAYGNIGTLDPNYNKGRTATHELGHWLGLRHIWGDASCGDDFCTDTPVQQTSNFGCPSYPKVSCTNAPNGEMFMNFMDYCDDPCLYMFTPDQNTRIQAAMVNGIYRKQLTASSATMCNLPPAPAVASFIAADNVCLDSLFVISNQSAGMPGPSYTWAASPNTGVTFSPSISAANPTINFSTAGFYTISVVATNPSGSSTKTMQVYAENCADDVGIHKNLVFSNNVSLVPNPANDAVTVQANGIKDFKVEIRNALGQQIFDVVSDNPSSAVTLDMSAFSEGIYIVTVSDGDYKTVKRLVISR